MSGDGGGYEVEEGGGRDHSRHLDSKGDPRQTEGADVGGC